MTWRSIMNWGKWGEDLAAKYLVSHGYYIRDRDWKSGKRDLDIVALNEAQNLLVFVEVKTRKDDNLANPEAAVDQKKILNLGRAANDYICQFALDYEVRFDIITVIGTNEADAKIDHFEDAFNPLLAL
jgi:putative endonuclease